MFTSEALEILRRSDDRFNVGRRMDAAWQAAGREIEIPIFWHRTPVGHLEHDEMPDRYQYPEVFGKYGVPWNEEAKAKGQRVFFRDPWQRCFREIIDCVPRHVGARVTRQLQKRGYRL
jgi:hypothetical protein